MHFKLEVYHEILSIVRDITIDPLFYDYNERLKMLDLSKKKSLLVFGLTLPSQCIDMSGVNTYLKKKNFYVSVKACNLTEFFLFIRLNKFDYIELYVSRVSCIKKWFTHWDHTSLKFYPYCKKSKEFLSYYFYPVNDNEIKVALENYFES